MTYHWVSPLLFFITCMLAWPFVLSVGIGSVRAILACLFLMALCFWATNATRFW